MSERVEGKSSKIIHCLPGDPLLMIQTRWGEFMRTKVVGPINEDDIVTVIGVRKGFRQLDVNRAAFMAQEIVLTYGEVQNIIFLPQVEDNDPLALTPEVLPIRWAITTQPNTSDAQPPR